ncbi:MAG: hypothetical protein F4213_18850 [Boseongicola sp. SB0677_bin_26]|nr:hypothetical protein [Boseongicola sp. SB0665_bin_10]MYG28050.1 hypothetical protein [Boseongicola sp. SB0677_bin_26]
MMKSRMTTLTAGLALAALAACVKDLPPGTPQGDYDPDSLPQTVAEAKAVIVASRGKKGFPDPPGNVRADDYAALFGDAVFVVNDGRRELGFDTPLDRIGVIFIGADGRYVWCKTRKSGNTLTSDHHWLALTRMRGPGLTPFFDPTKTGKPNGSGLSPLYDGTTGEAIFYTRNDGYWWDWNLGHLQERLPASTWTVCPDFPSAAEIGVGVNERQTATTYPALVAQDPGRRILRPDLVTPDPVEPVR